MAAARKAGNTAVERLVPRLQAMRRPGSGAEPVRFRVDGVGVSVEPSGRGLCLCCELLPEAPDDDGHLRGLMARYLPYADHGAEVLCLDAANRLVLAAPVEPEDDLRAVLRAFCDAAVFWTRAVAAAPVPPRPAPGSMTMIFP